MNNFKIIHKDGKARVGKLTTPHGVIETPNWIPVGTKATIKALSPRDLKKIGVQIVLANTYHLMLQPGADLIAKMGGLHKFMGWDGPIMTDSGGFQVFSLGVGLESGEEKVQSAKGKVKSEKEEKPRLAKVTEEGVTFQSHIDGSEHFLGPEESIKIQHQLRADLMVAFDDHESACFSYKDTLKSLELTERWGLRSKQTYEVLRMRPRRSILYGVVHGGLHKDLRVRSARFTDEHFDAIAIGGIYGKRAQLYQIVDWVTDTISDEKVRHLLGIGEPTDLFNAIERGVDLFDCVGPTRRARNGSLYISPKNGGNTKNNFTLNIRAGKFVRNPKPIDPGCLCYTCQNFSRAYLNHLYKSDEILYHFLATYHNVFFIIYLLKKIRNVIKVGAFGKLKIEYMGT